MEINRNVKINFNGGDLTSDAGLLLLKEFEQQIGFSSVVNKKPKTAYQLLKIINTLKKLMLYKNL